MPPVGANVSAFNVISERWTSARHSLSWVERSDHSCQYAVVRPSARIGSVAGGGSLWYEGYQVRTNGTWSPSRTTKSAAWRKSRPGILNGAFRRSALGPAIMSSEWSLDRTHGTSDP